MELGHRLCKDIPGLGQLLHVPTLSALESDGKQKIPSIAEDRYRSRRSTYLALEIGETSNDLYMFNERLLP